MTETAVAEKFTEEELLAFAAQARAEGHPMAASGILERVHRLRHALRPDDYPHPEHCTGCKS